LLGEKDLLTFKMRTKKEKVYFDDNDPINTIAHKVIFTDFTEEFQKKS
jgi:hypothetical protein